MQTLEDFSTVIRTVVEQQLPTQVKRDRVQRFRRKVFKAGGPEDRPVCKLGRKSLVHSVE